MSARLLGVGSVLLLVSGSAWAQLDKDAQKCIDGYNNKLRLVSQQAGKDARSCIKNAGKGAEPSPDTCIVNDTPGKVAGKVSKVGELYPAKCTGSEPIQQGASVGSQAHIDAVVNLAHDLFGNPVSGVSTPGKAEAKCQDKAIQRATQALTEKMKGFRKCKKDGMKAGSVSDSGTLEAQCMTPSIPDPAGKIGGKVQKLLDDVNGSCTGLALSALFPGMSASCTASTAALGACIDTKVECRTCQALNTADGTARDCDAFDDGTANGSCAGGLTQHACALAGSGASKIELNVEALPVPLSFNISGNLKIGLGSPNGSGIAPASCDIQNINPINIPSIGFVCISPGSGCPLGTADCDGGTNLGIDVVADGNIGSCTNNASCQTTCTTFCGGISGHSYLTSGCTGFCTEGSQSACTSDDQCSMASQGSCNGPDPVGSNNNICQCQCANMNAAGPNGAGTAQCQLASTFIVENAAPCDGTDVKINVGHACIPVTTSTATTVINHANFGTTTLGPFSNTGAAISCTTIDSSTTTGMQTRGVVNFFGSALGDIAVELFAQCQ